MGSLNTAVTGTVSGLNNNIQINAIVAALATLNAGGSAPTTSSTGLSSMADVWWLDTANKILKKRNHADTAWIPFATIDETNGAAFPIIPGFKFGMTLKSNSGTPNTKMDIEAGSVTDDTAVAVMNAVSSLTVDCTTNGANGMAGSESLAANKTIHFWTIGKADGTVAAFANRHDVSGLTPTLPSGYVYKRRRGSVPTDASSHLLHVTADAAGTFDLADTVTEYNATPGSGSANTLALTSVPIGISVRTNLVASSTSGGVAGNFPYFSALAQTDEAASATNAQVVSGVSTECSVGGIAVATDTSGHIRFRMSRSDASLVVGSHGWFDPGL